MKQQKRQVVHMPSSAQAKIEEREARKLLSAARTAKKEAAKKLRKHSGKKAAQTEPKKRYTPKSILVLKSELETTPAEQQQSASSAKKKGRNSKGRPSAGGSALQPQNAVEPPYSYEVHHKNKQVLVSVHLNKVPPQTIDIDATTATTFVVQTPKFTKKYFLAFELPSGIKIDPKAAEYTFDTGVLKCVLPIVGDLPNEVVAERAAMVEKFREQKALRFRMSKEGELVVRSRRAVLKQQDKASAATQQAKASTDSGAAPSVKLSTSTEKAGATKAQKAAASKDEKTAAINGGKLAAKAVPSPKVAKKAAPAVVKKASPTSGPSVSAVKSKQFVPDGSAMLAVAAEAGKQQRNQLYAKLEKAKQVQEQRSVRLSKRDGRKNIKREKNEATFARVIAAQKQQLLQRVEMAKPAPAKNPSESSKKVSFAK